MGPGKDRGGKRDGALLNNLIKEAIYELCRSGSLEEVHCGIAASYFLSLFPSTPLAGLVSLLDPSRVPINMVWLVLERLGSAFALYHPTPDLQVGLELLTRLRVLFVEEVGWEECEEEQLGVLLAAVEGTVGGLLRVSLATPEQECALEEGLLNVEAYRAVVGWLSRVSMLLRRREAQSSDHTRHITNTIEMLN